MLCLLSCTDIKTRSAKLSVKRDDLENYVAFATNVTTEWRELNQEINDTKEKIHTLNADFNNKLETIQNKSQNSLIMANARVAEFVEERDRRKAKTSVEDSEMVTQLISAGRHF